MWISIVALCITAIVLAVPVRLTSQANNIQTIPTGGRYEVAPTTQGETKASNLPTSPYERARDATFQVYWGGKLQGAAFLEKSGYVVTVFYLIDGASEDLSIRTVHGTTVPVRIAKVNKREEIALLELKEKLPDVEPLSLADSSTLSFGQPVVLIGSPFWIFPTATAGIISGLNKDGAALGKGCPTCTKLVQTDAATGPGSSGGPLVNEGGEVVGMLALMVLQSNAFNFAVSTEHIRALINSME